MKKLTVLALCMAAAISMTACGQGQSKAETASKQTESKADVSGKTDASSKTDTSSKTEESSEATLSSNPVETEEIAVSSDSTESELLAGGWETPASPKVPEEIKEKLDKALEELVGADYEAVAYLGSQLVAGRNYKLLCRITPVVPDAVDHFAIVTLYEDLEGKVEITEILDSEKESNFSDMPGGWQKTETQEMTDEAKAALEKALSEMVGATYKPLALVATQVVAGTNYCILCEITPVVPDAESNYGLVYVYEDLEGNAEITEIADFATGEIKENEHMTQIPNPIVDYETLEEAATAAGVTLKVPENVQGYSEKTFQAIAKEIVQVVYSNNENRLFIRKANGDEDISGDYNLYKEEKQVKVGEYDVTLKGNDGKVSTAIWTKGGCTFAVMSDTPMTAEAMEAIIAEIA